MKTSTNFKRLIFDKTLVIFRPFRVFLFSGFAVLFFVIFCIHPNQVVPLQVTLYCFVLFFFQNMKKIYTREFNLIISKTVVIFRFFYDIMKRFIKTIQRSKGTQIFGRQSRIIYLMFNLSFPKTRHSWHRPGRGSKKSNLINWPEKFQQRCFILFNKIYCTGSYLVWLKSDIFLHFLNYVFFVFQVLISELPVVNMSGHGNKNGSLEHFF